MTKIIKVGINGMGRIGRTVLRAILQEKNPFLKVVAIFLHVFTHFLKVFTLCLKVFIVFLKVFLFFDQFT